MKTGYEIGNFREPDPRRFWPIQHCTGLAPPNNLESAIRIALQSGNYTAILSGKNNTTGVGLVEVYDIEKSVFARP